MKTSLLTIAGVFALATFANAYPKYEYGAYAKVKPQNRTATTIAVMVERPASTTGVVHPTPFKKGAGFVRY